MVIFKVVLNIRWVVVLLVVLISACTEEKQQRSSQNPIKKPELLTNLTILALGDSLTEGLGVAQSDNYPAILQRLLPNTIKVVNAGLSGETSKGLKNRLDWVLKIKPDVTILNIGANDAIRGLPLEFTKKNIDAIIAKILASGSDVILAGMQIYDNLGKEYVKDFSLIYPELATKHKIIIIPDFLKNVAGVAQYNQQDLLHPNAKGYQIIVKQNILPIVKNYLKHK